MRSAAFAMSGLAAVALGVMAGLATDPVPRIPADADWRARYRAAPAPEPEPIVDLGLQDRSAWPYGIPPLAQRYLYAPPLRAVPDYVPTPPLEMPLPDDPWAREEHLAAAGRAAIAAALGQTSGIDAMAEDEPESDEGAEGPAPLLPPVSPE